MSTRSSRTFFEVSKDLFLFVCWFVCLFSLPSTEDSAKVAEELKRADAVVLTYACDQPQTLDRLSTFWLPKLRQLEVRFFSLFRPWLYVKWLNNNIPDLGANLTSLYRQISLIWKPKFPLSWNQLSISIILIVIDVDYNGLNEQVRVPVIVVGCKLDLRDENQQVSLEQVMSPIMQQFREIETCIECSAFKHIQVYLLLHYSWFIKKRESCRFVLHCFLLVCNFVQYH